MTTDARSLPMVAIMFTAALPIAACLQTEVLEGDQVTAANAVTSKTGSDVSDLLDAYHQANRFDGSALVAVSGEVVFQGGFGYANREWSIKNSAETRSAVGSLGKLLTALLVLQLADQETLRLEGSIGDYLPDYPSASARSVTISQLLTHTSGLADYFDRDFFENHMFKPYSREEFFERFCTPERAQTPGSAGVYSSTNYCILGAIVEGVTGLDFDSALQSHILEPLGMTSTSLNLSSRVVPQMASGYVRGFSGYRRGPWEHVDLHAYGPGSMVSTVGDLFALDRALYGSNLFSDLLKSRLYEKAAPSSLGAEGLEAKVEVLESSGEVETSQQGLYSLGRALIEEGRPGGGDCRVKTNDQVQRCAPTGSLSRLANGGVSI